MAKPIVGLTGNDTFIRWFDATNELITATNNSLPISLKEFGAVGDGVTDDTTAFQAALNSGYKQLYVGTGVYKISSTLTIQPNMTIYGDGPESSIIDGSSMTSAQFTNTCHFQVQGTTWAELAKTSLGLTKGSKIITFPAAQAGLTANDYLLIYNGATGSFNPIRYYYRAGEIQRIARITGVTAVVQGTFYDNYPSGLTAYKLQTPRSCTIKNLALKGAGLTAAQVMGFRLKNIVDSVIENVKVSNCSYSGIHLDQSINVSINNCEVNEDHRNDFGGDYGLVISNSQNVSVNGGHYSASRHAITIGGSDGVGAVPSRFIKFYGVNMHCSSDNTLHSICAYDNHGNAEEIIINGCFIDGGANIGGDNVTIDGCRLFGLPTSLAYDPGGSLIFGSEFRGANFSIINNQMTTQYSGVLGSGAFIEFGSQGSGLSAGTKFGGVISVKNNTFNWEYNKNSRITKDKGEEGNYEPVGGVVPNGNAFQNRHWISFGNSSGGYTGEDVNIVIEGNTVIAPKNYPQGTAYVINSCGLTGGQFDNIIFSNNTCINAGGLYAVGGSTNWVANNVICENNNITNSYAEGFFANPVKNLISCTNNKIFQTRLAPLYFRGYSNATTLRGYCGMCENIIIRNNNIINSPTISPDVASVSQTYYLGQYAQKGIFEGNAFGSNTKTMYVDKNTNFVLNENITGSVSGVVGTVLGFYGSGSGADQQIGIGSSNTEFTPNEFITGSISGATAQITVIQPTGLTFSLYKFTNLWKGSNVIWDQATGVTFTVAGGGTTTLIT